MAAKKKTVRKKKAPTARVKKPVGATVAKVTPSRDGGSWTLAMSDGAKAKVSSAAAQSAGVRVGMRWTAATATRVEDAAQDQRLFLRAMQVLAKKGRTSGDALSKLLGGDARAKRTVVALRKNGWIG